MKVSSWCAAFFAALVGAVASCFGTVLYNGGLNTSPVSQGFLNYSAAVGSTPSGTNFFTVNTGSLTMDSTSDLTIHSGFFNYNSTLSGLQNSAFPTLNRTTGYTISVNMQTILENHNNGSSRAGFSLIALSSDDMGIEIGFWANEVFSQTSTFTQGQTDLFDTTAALREYDLNIQGSSYTFSTGGTTLLTGALQNYSGAGVVPNVYALPNFVFFGDDTTEASGQDTVSAFSVAVPEPTGLSMGLSGVLGGAWLAGRRLSRKTRRTQTA